MTKEQAEQILKEISNIQHGRTPEAKKRAAARKATAAVREAARATREAETAARAERAAVREAAREATRKAQKNGNGAAPNRRRTWKNYLSCTGPGCGANAPANAPAKAQAKLREISRIISGRNINYEVTNQEVQNELNKLGQPRQENVELNINESFYRGGKRKHRRTLKNKRK